MRATCDSALGDLQTANAGAPSIVSIPSHSSQPSNNSTAGILAERSVAKQQTNQSADEAGCLSPRSKHLGKGYLWSAQEARCIRIPCPTAQRAPALTAQTNTGQRPVQPLPG